MTTSPCMVKLSVASGMWLFSPFLYELQVTPEDMEAYRMKKVHHDDPMRDFLH